MNIAHIVPTEVSGICDIATGQCIVVETEIDTPHDTATGEISQLSEVPDDGPGVFPRPWQRQAS